MEQRPTCQPETVFLGNSCDIQYCFDCKMIHLNLGAVTLRLSRHQFQEFMDDLTKGSAKLRQKELNTANFLNNISTLHS